MMSFGRRNPATVAGTPYARTGNVAVRGAFAPRSGAVVGYTPRPRGAGVGACGDGSTNPPGGTQAWCYNTQGSRPIPLGAGPVAIPAFAAGASGTNNVTLLPVEAFVIEDIEVTDPTGLLFVSSVQIGRMQLLEGGTISTDYFQSASTKCKLAQGATIYPTTGIVFTFTNPTNAIVNVSVVVTGTPVPCPQGGLK